MAAAHAHGSDAIKNAVRAGVASIEHGSYMDEEAAELMVKHGVFWVPTVKALQEIVDGASRGVPEFAVKKAAAVLLAQKDAFKMAKGKGVGVAMGTDAGTPYNPHGQNARELELMVERGMENLAVVKAATASAARLLGLQDKIGLVKPGMEADLLVLAKNPLDDVSAFHKSLEMVIKGGLIVRRGETLASVF